MRVQLLKDVVGRLKEKRLYGSKNEVLNVISQRGDVLIVKGKRENFPVNIEDVKIIEQ